MRLEALGWDDLWREAFEPLAARGYVPGRVAADHAHDCHVLTAQARRLAVVAGALLDPGTPESRPVTGDWVALEAGTPACVRAVLRRRSAVSRKAAGARAESQVLAANIDWLMLVDGLDSPPNRRRLERLMVLARASGARPAVVLNKSDLCPEAARHQAETATWNPDVPVLLTSATGGCGLDQLLGYLQPGRTAAFLGPSGVGKSSLINGLMGADALATRPVREADGRGRHTTARRELLLLPGGGLVIDTPGLREVAVWEDGGALAEAFSDIEGLAASCAFRDCSHTVEPGCAVLRAVAERRLEAGRLESFVRLRSELRRTAERRDVRFRLEQKRKWKTIHKTARHFRPRGFE